MIPLTNKFIANIMRHLKFLSAIPLVLIGFSFLQEDGIKELLQPGAQLEKLADGFLFTEGPSADSKGNVFFTSVSRDWIPFPDFFK